MMPIASVATYSDGRMENELREVVLEDVHPDVHLAQVVRLPSLRLRLEPGKVEHLPGVLTLLIQSQTTTKKDRSSVAEQQTPDPRNPGFNLTGHL